MECGGCDYHQSPDPAHFLWVGELLMQSSKLSLFDYRLNGREFEYTPAVGDGQGGLVGCSPWGCTACEVSAIVR